MRWSAHLGKVFGIGIYLHWTFLLLLGWVFFMYWRIGQNAAVAAEGVLFVLVLFSCVVLHELGHALTARRYGIGTRDITLLPIGGVARLERMPRDPAQELMVALAGPAVNVIIAGALLLALLLTRRFPAAMDMLQPATRFLTQLMWVNLFLVVFNLLPAFPMDGGRVLRALLARRLSYERATFIAARVGQTLAVVLGTLGVIYLKNPFLAVIGVFVFIGAQAEAQMVRLSGQLARVPVSEAMIKRFRALSPDDPLQHAAQELLAGSQHDFPVVSGSEVLGVLTRQDLVRALSEAGPNVTVRRVMRSDCPVVSDNEQLERSYERLRQEGYSTLPVVHEGHLVGLITLDNILEWMMVHSALSHRFGLLAREGVGGQSPFNP